ncbi:hypothetical protein J4731_07995 [Providencia rettgeri]|nr:hypothetical protein [Providencia rettgeri]
MIVGMAAMHSGWFPATAAALISLMIGILLGFPEALAVLVGFVPRQALLLPIWVLT